MYIVRQISLAEIDLNSNTRIILCKSKYEKIETEKKGRKRVWNDSVTVI